MAQTKLKQQAVKIPPYTLHALNLNTYYRCSYARKIEQDLAFFLQYDPFVVDKEGHRYPVRSLYYDDPVYFRFLRQG